MKILLLITAFCSFSSWSYETHDLNCMGHTQPDIRMELNGETNRRIQLALSQTNVSGGPSCPRENLTAALKKGMAHPWTDNLETWVEKSSLGKCRISSSRVSRMEKISGRTPMRSSWSTSRTQKVCVNEGKRSNT